MMNDKIRIGMDYSDTDGRTYAPFMVRTGRKTVAYGYFKPNHKAKNPTIGGTQIYLFDPKDNKTRKVGSLRNLLPEESTQSYSILGTRNVRNGIYKGLKTLATNQSSTIKSSVNSLRRAHYPASFTRHMTGKVVGPFPRS